LSKMLCSEKYRQPNNTILLLSKMLCSEKYRQPNNTSHTQPHQTVAAF